MTARRCWMRVCSPWARGFRATILLRWERSIAACCRLRAEFKQVIAYSITERGTEALYQSAAVGSSKRSHLDPERQMAEYAVLDYLAEGELVREATLRSATDATREMLRNLVAKEVDRPRRSFHRARCPSHHKNCHPERA